MNALQLSTSSADLAGFERREEGGGSKRLIYLDNLRWGTVVLVVFYHVCFIFNGVGASGGIPGARSIAAFDALLYVVYPWFMLLLFVIAGISARDALQTRTGKQFLRGRAVKLLVPSTLGLFVLHWVTGWLNIKMGGGLDYIPSFLLYPISAVSGIGPLWFAQMLFCFSCVIALLKKLDRTDRIWRACGRANFGVVLLLVLPLWGAAQVGNLPVLTMYRFGVYLAAFLIGYYVLSHDGIQEAVARFRIPLLILAAAGVAAFTWRYYGSDYSSPHCLQSLFTNLCAWVAVLAALGCGRAWFNRENPFTRRMNRAGYGLYLLHYPVLTVTGYLLHYFCELPSALNYGIALTVTLTATLALAALIRRIPALRYLLLGVEKRVKNGGTGMDIPARQTPQSSEDAGKPPA